jgi:hypothetical protein
MGGDPAARLQNPASQREDRKTCVYQMCDAVELLAHKEGGRAGEVRRKKNVTEHDLGSTLRDTTELLSPWC